MSRKDTAAHEGALYADGRRAGLREACALFGIDAALLTETLMRRELAALARKVAMSEMEAQG